MAYEGIVQNYPEPNLVPENIRKDKTIFGVVGSLEDLDIDLTDQKSIVDGSATIFYVDNGNLFIIKLVSLGGSAYQIRNNIDTQNRLKSLFSKTTLDQLFTTNSSGNNEVLRDGSARQVAGNNGTQITALKLS